MANTAHLVRRQSSRDLNPQRSLDRLEMKEMRGRLMVVENGSNSSCSYGATNAAFEDTSPNTKLKSSNSSKRGSHDQGKVFKPECAEEERESWDSKLTFLLATVGYAVGLGNVWRFPYLAQKNGGGAFLIPYFVMLAVEGIPIFYLELAIGQRLRKGAIGVWSQVSPFLSGIGISSAVVSFNVALYYNTIIAWCLFYFVQSFQSELPWSECPKVYFPNSSYIEEPECTVSSPTQYFWYRTTLLVSKDIDNPESFNWKIALALVIAWILVYMCMIKGIASSGKVVYVTATFPYIVLIIFFFRGITLKGAGDGLMHLFTPKWHTILDPVVWLEAGTQIFFSLGLAFGGLIAFSSYNPVNNNCYRDALMVSMTNCFTSMFAGIVVFSIIGFKATMTYEKCLEDRNATAFALGIFDLAKLPVCDLQKELDNSASGTGLAFIIFTEAINQFPGAQFWSVLFFLMLFTLGIDSQFGTLEGVVTSIVDMKLFPNLRKEILTGVICLTCCLLSLGFAHGAGSYIFVLFDNFSGNFPLLIIALFECIAVSYVYGLKRFADDIEMMTGSRPGLYWLICWKYLSPLAMISILIASFVEIAVDGSGYDAWVASLGITERHGWPTWAIVLIIFLVCASILWIPGIAICRLFGIVIIEDDEKAWFPANDLKDFHGIMPHEVTTAEKLLFCIRDDGSEGLCCPTGGTYDEDEDN
ncbi:PREDICTED: sodium-dependent neutral amino acid transporter B(0)AT3 isoform X2 [Nicrophorus vespilloides]|uniref:Transporter n=1 Tax=Nicrophorus vespilloides TaxID=110193 RepID=A0ABM1MYX1_NICVS|nr:PREDICTED: sodium-dependent neutral amino acid transporter B(0)AT3 isoform X1 [Nicrophorus vespilloides]XP_017779771.1 PREDICTED: sodium-dependent neutral amino acid transporter B(0)AT3 isoform X2 [Nicrophorus vespilloides]